MLDTILIEPDLRRVLLTWRASVPLRRNMFEMRASAGRPHAARLVAGARAGQDLLSRRSTHSSAATGRARGGGASMTAPPVAILGCGMTTGVGLTAPASCAAIRAPSTTSARPASWRAAASGSSAARCRWRSRGAACRGWRACWQGRSRECLDLITDVPPEEIPVLLCVAETDRPGRLDGLGRPAVLRGLQSCSACASTRTRAMIAHGPGRRRRRRCASQHS